VSAEAGAARWGSRTSLCSGAERGFKAREGSVDGFLVGVLVHVRCEVDGRVSENFRCHVRRRSGLGERCGNAMTKIVESDAAHLLRPRDPGEAIGKKLRVPSVTSKLFRATQSAVPRPRMIKPSSSPDGRKRSNALAAWRAYDARRHAQGQTPA